MIYGKQLSDDAKELLAEAANNGGMIACIMAMAGLNVSAGQRSFVAGNDRRGEAKWKAAKDELFLNGLIEDSSGQGTIFSVTNAGYNVVDASA